MTIPSRCGTCCVTDFGDHTITEAEAGTLIPLTSDSVAVNFGALVKLPIVNDTASLLFGAGHELKAVRTSNTAVAFYFDGVAIPGLLGIPIGLAYSFALGYRIYSSPDWDGFLGAIGGTPPAAAIIDFKHLYRSGQSSYYLPRTIDPATLAGAYGYKGSKDVQFIEIYREKIKRDYSLCESGGSCATGTACPSNDPCNKGCYDAPFYCRWSCWEEWRNHVTLTISGFTNYTAYGCPINLTGWNGDYILSRRPGGAYPDDPCWYELGVPVVVDGGCEPCSSQNGTFSPALKLRRIRRNTYTGTHDVCFEVKTSWTAPGVVFPLAYPLMLYSDIMSIDGACDKMQNGGSISMYPLHTNGGAPTPFDTCVNPSHTPMLGQDINTGVCTDQIPYPADFSSGPIAFAIQFTP